MWSKIKESINNNIKLLIRIIEDLWGKIFNCNLYRLSSHLCNYTLFRFSNKCKRISG